MFHRTRTRSRRTAESQSASPSIDSPQSHSPQPGQKFGRMPWRMVLAILALCFPLAVAVAEQSPDDGAGIQARVGHNEGQGVPQVLPLTPIELFPYYLIEDSLIFSDLRFYTTNSATVGGNVGLGYRYYSSDYDRVFGISGWYDADNARELYFQQLGLSIETYADPLDIRANFYLPVGPTERLSSLTLVPGSTRFMNDNIVYSQNRSWYSAMKGLDAEAGILVPGDFAAEHGIRVYGGGYHFSDDQGNKITGGSARIQANIVAGLDAMAQITHDNYFETRGFFAISWTFGALHFSQLKQDTAFGRIGEHVTRNYTVVAPLRHQVENLIAINPATGQPYTVSHVSSAAGGGGTGGVNNPFQTIADGQAAHRDFVFVHAGSIFNGPDATVVLNQGDRIFGDGAGVQHHIAVPGLGSLLVPHGPTFGNRPLLNGSPGDTVVLASSSEIAGFTIANSGGNAVSGSGVGNVMVRSVDILNPALNGISLAGNFGSSTFSGININGAGNNGVFLQNNVGNASFDGLAVANTTISGINIDGGSGTADFLRSVSITNPTGSGVAIRNLTSAAEVSFHDLSIDHRHNRGVEIANSAGTVLVTGKARVTNESGSTASAIDAQNFTGNINFNRVEVTDATGDPGINLANNSGQTLFGQLDITSHDGTALKALNAGYLGINPTTGNNQVDSSRLGTISAVNGTAFDVQSTELNANFKSISSSNAINGIRMVSTTGTFNVYGSGTENSGGTITGATNAIFLQDAGRVAINWMKLDGNGTGIHADNVDFLGIGYSNIKNSTGYAIDAHNLTTLTVANSSLTDNAAGNIRGTFDVLRSYTYTITGTELTSGAADNIALTLLGGGTNSTMSLVAQNDTFKNTLAGSSGLKINWNGILSTSVDNSLFSTSGGTNTGIDISNASTTSLTSVSVNKSSFSSTGSGGDTFLHLAAAGPAQVSLTGNDVQLQATNGTGFRMALGANSSVTITGNDILDTTDGATGMLFDSITGPTSLRIEDNLIHFANSGALIDRGIYFSSVTSSADNTVRLSGSFDNQVSGANPAFYVPFGTTTGSIFVNGNRVP